MQAALPQGIVPFVFAKEYNVHPDILSTGSVLSLHFISQLEIDIISLIDSGQGLNDQSGFK